MLYELCIFDLDGTLTDPYEGLAKGIEYAMKKLGLGDVLENPGSFIGPPIHESFMKTFNLTQDKANEAVETFREYYGEIGIFENYMYPGIDMLLQTLKQNGALTAVATSKPDKFARLVLKHFNIYGYFDFINGDTPDGSLSRNGKGTLIRNALDALDPGREKTAVMIGDRKHDILGAREAGIGSIGVAWGYGSLEELADAGAAKIATGADDLLRLLGL